MFKATEVITAALVLLAVAGCASSNEAKAVDPLQGMEQVEPALAPDSPAPAPSSFDPAEVEHGRYLTDLLGCGNCHTDGALVGKPDASRTLAGSGVGIAISDPMQVRQPGIVFPSNLTPDRETGLGDWSLGQIIKMIQTGMDRHGKASLPVMPWMTYSRLKPGDAEAIAMYLASLPPVKHPVPKTVRPGHPSPAPYVHFGVYRSEK